MLKGVGFSASRVGLSGGSVFGVAGLEWPLMRDGLPKPFETEPKHLNI